MENKEGLRTTAAEGEICNPVNWSRTQGRKLMSELKGDLP
ncbi:hypothetical protein CCACVL1_15552 [Corchorus capsularis]|uniref:Uncharacterized protein n=1 Tax=Corchorus capsularis TaxID=210143 RepID=A0A1R3I1S2_COCAP|nr:hypothetical protein CCACVL1_15552 [Corchorus capsularis]